MGLKIDLGNVKPSKSYSNKKASVSRINLSDSLKKNTLKTSSLIDTDTNFNGLYSSINTNSSLAKLKNNIAKPKKKKNKILRFFILFILVFIIGLLVFIGIKYLQTKNDLSIVGIDLNVDLNPVHVIQNQINPPAASQLYRSGEFTNVLFIGIDAREKNGVEGNTDSLQIGSLNNKTHKITMISIPRDTQAYFYVGKNNKTVIKDKINAAYYIADSNNYPGGGLALLRSTVSNIMGLQINYTIQINFNSFKQIVDKIGGIDVNVENSFTDYTYPNDSDTGVITISFKTGQQHMDGLKALEYARSRHSLDNGEGSDFSRAKRQQKVIVAIEEKIKSSSIVTTIGQLSDFVQIFSQNVRIEKTLDSNSSAEKVNTTDFDAIMHLKDSADTKNVVSAVLDPNIGGYDTIVSVIPNIGTYSIGPTIGLGNYSIVSQYVNFIINTPDLYIENKSPEQNGKLGFFDAGYGIVSTNTEIINTNKDFVLSEYAAHIVPPFITAIANSTTNTNTQILSGIGIYDLTHKKPNTKSYLINKYNAQELTADQIPDNVKKMAKNYDLVLFFAK